MSNFKYGLKSQGVPILGGQALFTQGNSYFVDPTKGSDSYNGKTIGRAKATIAAAYALATAGQNDVIYYLAGTSGVAAFTAALTWAKSYTHLIGICSPVGMGLRARIFQDASTSGLNPLINITASSCIFKNLYIFHGVADATSKVCVQVTGNYNYFENVHFAGIGNNSMDVDEAACLKLDGAHYNKFVGCHIGLDTIDAGSAATNCEIWFDSESSKSEFVDCVIYRRIEHTTNHPLVLVEDALGIGAFTIFKRCLFLYTSVNMAVKGDTIFSIPAISSKTRVIILQDCIAVAGTTSATDWDSNNRGILYNNQVAAASAAAGGLATIQ